jgi:hypothetical protein
VDPAGSAAKLLPPVLKPAGTWVVGWLAGFRSPQTLALRRYQRRLMKQARDHLPLQVEDAGRRTRLEQVLTRHKHVVVSGEPGAGKSTLLRHLAVEFARGGRDARKAAIPVVVDLIEVAAKDVDACVLDQLRRAEFFRAEKFHARALKDGTLRVLLDGLDEVPVENRGHVVRRVLAFMAEYDTCTVVVTCRSAVREPALWARMHPVQVAELDDELIRRFVNARLGVGESRTEELLAELFARPGILALARVPLLLELLIKLKVPGASIPLTTSRAGFYREAVDSLLSPRNAEAGTDPERNADAYDVLRGLALTGKDSSGGDWIVFDRPTALDHAAVIVNEERPSVKALFQEIVHSGLLRREGTRRYRFGHLSFQDYFAADALDADGLLTRFDQDPDRWQEPAVLWCGLNDATEVVRHLLRNDSLTALECLGEAGTVDEDVARSVVSRFASDLAGAEADSQVVRAFGAAAAGNSAVFGFLRAEVTRPGDRRAAAAHALAMSGLPTALDVLGGLYDSTPEVRKPLARMGDHAIPVLVANGGENALDGLTTIGTTAALRAIVGLLWRDDERAARAAWRVAEMISDPRVEAALARLETPRLVDHRYHWVWTPFTADRTTLKIVNRVSHLILHGTDVASRPMDKRLAIALGFIEPNLVLYSRNPPSQELADIALLMRKLDEPHQDRPQDVIADTFFEVREDQTWCALQRRFFDAYLRWRNWPERQHRLLTHVPHGDMARLMAWYRFRGGGRLDEWIHMGERSPGLLLVAIACGAAGALGLVNAIVVAVVQTARTFFPGGAFSLDAVPWLRAVFRAVGDAAGWLWHLGSPSLVSSVLGLGVLGLGWTLRRRLPRIAGEIVGGTLAVVTLVLLALLLTMPVVWAHATQRTWVLGAVMWIGTFGTLMFAWFAAVQRRDRATTPLRAVASRQSA